MFAIHFFVFVLLSIQGFAVLIAYRVIALSTASPRRTQFGKYSFYRILDSTTVFYVSNLVQNVHLHVVSAVDMRGNDLWHLLT